MVYFSLAYQLIRANHVMAYSKTMYKVYENKFERLWRIMGIIYNFCLDVCPDYRKLNLCKCVASNWGEIYIYFVRVTFLSVAIHEKYKTKMDRRWRNKSTSILKFEKINETFSKTFMFHIK